MIATILPSSSNFHAVEYNELKVSQGKAELLVMENFGYLSELGNCPPKEITDYLVQYSSRNERIRKAQFHLAISCKGSEYSLDELVGIAKQYLLEMGYGRPGQPLLIYGHHDTDNNHVHVITSRVDPDGKKINHHHERIRSQEVINRIMGVNEEQRMSDAVTETLQYNFESVRQFQAILESMGYECFKGDGEIILKRNGVVQEKINQRIIEDKCQKDPQHDNKRLMQLRAIFKRYRDLSSDKKELQDTMKAKFGISLLYLGRKDSPYGYMIVDHHHKSVYKGSEVLKLKELLNFQTKEERFSNIDVYIDKLLNENPLLITKDLNRKLKRQFGCRIMNGCVLFGGTSHQIPNQMMVALRMNDRRAWLQSFSPSTEIERDLLCKMGKYNHPEKIELMQKDEKTAAVTIDNLRHLLNHYSNETIKEKLHEDGYMVAAIDEQRCCIDFANRTIINMNEYGLELISDKKEIVAAPKQHVPIMENYGINKGMNKIINQRGGANDGNREWEVGSQGYDNIDDERKLKR